MDSEEVMWKRVYDKLQKQKSVDHTPHELRIQESDGAFFERFGSLLREHAELVQENEDQEKARVAEAAAKVTADLQREDSTDEETTAVNVADSDSDADTVTTSDSEIDERNQAEYLNVGWNIEELYSEILYEILHNVGCDVSCEIGQTALFSYVQDAFKISTERHRELLAAVGQKEAPERLLNVEIVEAKDLTPKDSNGLSDPFVTLFLSSNTSRRYNTSVKMETLNPVWEEHFALPVGDNVMEDALCLEVWDFDPAESVREKLGKIFQVKGVRGVRKLVKEIAITAAMGQHENELIGKAHIPLKAIPACGMTMWYSLDKKNKTNRRGIVKVQLLFGSEKNTQVASQEYRHLLRLILLFDLESMIVNPYTWNGRFSVQGEALLLQHSVQSGLSPTDVALAQWIIFCSVHVEHPLSFALFANLLEKLLRPTETSQTLNLSEEDTRLFWDATKKLLPSCFAIIRKIRKKYSDERNAMKQLQDILYILSKLIAFPKPEQINMFPSNLYGWLTYKDNDHNNDISLVLSDAITEGGAHWFTHILENNVGQDNSPKGRLEYLIKIVQLVRSDLQKATEYYDKLFHQTVHLQYAKTLYVMYQVKISTQAEPDVTEICKSMKALTYVNNTTSQLNPNESLAVGTTLFELYLALQRFYILGTGLCPLEYDTFHIINFHKWFHGGVAQWLDIAVYKALQRIEKAVELDALTPVDSTVKYSSSALDTLTIFYQVRVFWQQLNWPDVEGSYTFIAKIIDDICRCCVFYADKMSSKVDGMGDVHSMYEKRFEVTNEWCLAINNIDYVRQSLIPFTEELGMRDIIQKLSDLRSPVEADRCRQTLKNVIENSIDTVRNKIIELLEIVADKMAPAMTKLLVEGAELLHQDSNSIDRVMMYLDNNLATLHTHLNEDNFERILDIIWDNLRKILSDLIQSNLDKRRPPSFFANLHETLKLMVKCFKQSEEDSQECSALKRIEYLLKVNGLETSELIHEVCLEQWRDQSSESETPFGQLTVRLQFINTDLKIEVINARNLKPMDSNGLCDSFVRIHLLPEEKFTTVVKPKTQTHNKNLFPLYDETFTINLTSEQKKLPDGLVMFNVKDKDFLGMSNQYIGEAFVHFSDIPDTTNPITSLPQVHLTLGRPTELNTDAIKALEHRQGDKQAREFIKKLKQKMSTS